MSDKEKAELMREFVKALEIFDLEKSYSLCTDDFTWVMPMTNVKGKEEFSRHSANPFLKNLRNQ